METIYLDKNQRISELGPVIFPHIPSNYIIFKNLAGIGATTMEIEDRFRHSIIIEPNVPVIIGKAKKHPHVLGVYKDVTSNDIYNYLMDDSIPIKKIITTPESFSKIYKTFSSNDTGFDLYEDFFLLFDECDKITYDINYRENIKIPLQFFFEFKNKAFISATAVKPTDPRFEEHNFKYLSILPKYAVTEDIQLHITNNPISLLEILIKKGDGNKNFIFFNSIRGIEKAISKLNIANKSAVFCSDKASYEINDSVGYVSTTIEESQCKEYNFITSRFFSAVDIDIDYDCNIYLVSDLHIAEHSALDPKSDVIQIIGRFRNKEYKRNINLITNCNPNLNSFPIEDANRHIETLECVYNTLKNYRDASSKKSERYALGISLQSLPFNKFLDSNGYKCFFLIDNFILENIRKTNYLKPENLIEAYQNACLHESEVKYFNTAVHYRDFYTASNDDFSKKLFRTYKSNIKLITELLINRDKYEVLSDIYLEINLILKDLMLFYPEIFQALELGLKDKLLDRNTYSKRHVVKFIKEKLIEECDECIPFIETIRNEFEIGLVQSGDNHLKLFKSILDRYDLNIPASFINLKRYLKLTSRFKGTGKNRNIWFYKVLDHK